MIYEINKKLLREQFNGNLDDMIKEEYFVDWTEDRIRLAFNFGHGTMDDFTNYKTANRNISLFVEC